MYEDPTNPLPDAVFRTVDIPLAGFLALKGCTYRVENPVYGARFCNIAFDPSDKLADALAAWKSGQVDGFRAYADAMDAIYKKIKYVKSSQHGDGRR